MTVSRRRFEVVPPDWGQAHLTSDAVVAFVDDELSSGAHTRAAAHLRVCLECGAEVAAQTQARSALRGAQIPAPPSSLLHALRSIPGVAELPGPPAGLAMSPDGRLVQALRPVPMPPRAAPPSAMPSSTRPSFARPSSTRPSSTPVPSAASVYPSSAPTAFGSRRFRLGAAVAASGMALGAIVLVASADSTEGPAAGAERGVFGGPVLEARLQLDKTPVVVEATQH